MAEQYAVIGNPVGHSKSPWIHTRFAQQCGQDIEYAARLAPLDGFARSIKELRAAGARGTNVTLPFKEEACRLSDHLSDRARAAGAVNTLTFSGSEMHGDNTDGCGLARDLANNIGFSMRGRRVLLMGAGGAARGVLLPLLGEMPAALVIGNRTVEKARQLAAQFPGVSAGAYQDLAGERFDLVINATSAGLTNTPVCLPPRIFSEGALAYDMVYGRKSDFLNRALADGAARTADGLGMLVEQAAESFFIWRGVRPQTAPVLAELRAA